jgi:hypothetical protein
LNVLEMLEINASQEVIPHRIDLDVTVGKDPITRGEYQAVMVVASNSTTGKELESFYRARNKGPNCDYNKKLKRELRVISHIHLK